MVSEDEVNKQRAGAVLRAGAAFAIGTLLGFLLMMEGGKAVRAVTVGSGLFVFFAIFDLVVPIAQALFVVVLLFRTKSWDSANAFVAGAGLGFFAAFPWGIAFASQPLVEREILILLVAADLVFYPFVAGTVQIACIWYGVDLIKNTGPYFSVEGESTLFLRERTFFVTAVGTICLAFVEVRKIEAGGMFGFNGILVVVGPILGVIAAFKAGATFIAAILLAAKATAELRERCLNAFLAFLALINGAAVIAMTKICAGALLGTGPGFTASLVAGASFAAGAGLVTAGSLGRRGKFVYMTLFGCFLCVLSRKCILSLVHGSIAALQASLPASDLQIIAIIVSFLMLLLLSLLPLEMPSEFSVCWMLHQCWHSLTVKQQEILSMSVAVSLVICPFFLKQSFCWTTVSLVTAASFTATAMLHYHASKLVISLEGLVKRMLTLYTKLKAENTLLAAASVTLVAVVFAADTEFALSQLCFLGVGTFITTATLLTIFTVWEESTGQHIGLLWCEDALCTHPVVLGATTGLAIGGVVLAVVAVELAGMEIVVMGLAGACVVVTYVIEGQTLTQFLLRLLKSPMVAFPHSETPTDAISAIICSAVVGSVIGTTVWAAAEGLELTTAILLVSAAYTVFSLVETKAMISKGHLIILVVISEAIVSVGIQGLYAMCTGIMLGKVLCVQKVQRSTVETGLSGIMWIVILVEIGNILKVNSEILETVAVIFIGIEMITVAVSAGAVSGLLLGLISGGVAGSAVFNYEFNKTFSLEFERISQALIYTLLTTDFGTEVLGLDVGGTAHCVFTVIPGVLGDFATATRLVDNFQFEQAAVVVSLQTLIMVMWKYKTGRFSGLKAGAWVVFVSLGLLLLLQFGGLTSMFHNSLVEPLVHLTATSGMNKLMMLHQIAAINIGGKLAVKHAILLVIVIFGSIIMPLSALGNTSRQESGRHDPEAAVPTLWALATSECAFLQRHILVFFMCMICECDSVV